MAFTNVWDTTFPPDTQLANLLGQDIRQGVKVDVQQRMAAISGLDAAKPNFAGDAQPANWNGILFFATDTGSIYQFNNPAWTNVTTSIGSKNPAIKNTTLVTQTGDVINHAIYTIPINAGFMGATGQLRVSLFMRVNSAAGHPTINITYGGSVIAQSIALNAALANTDGIYIMTLGGNLGVTNSQSWDTMAVSYGAAAGLGNGFHTTSVVDSTILQNLIVNYQGGLNADSVTFYRIIVELL